MAFDLPNLDQYLPPLSPIQFRPPAKPQEDPDAAYNALTPNQRAWVDKQMELQARPRSAPGEIGAGIARGAVSALPKMVGQALQSTGQPGDTLHGLGTSLVEGAAAREPGWAEDVTPDAHNAVTRAFAQGGEMLAPSLAPMAALPLLALGGVPAAAGLAVAGAAGGALFAASQYQQTYEKAIKEGKTPEQAHALGLQTGAVEGLGETAGTYFGGKFLSGAGKIFPRVLGGEKLTVDAALTGLRDPKFLKNFAKSLGETALVETGTEMGQNYGETAIEHNAGIEQQSPWDAATQAIGPTLAMTALLGPLGGLSLRRQQNRNKALVNITESPDATTDQVAKASRALMPQLEPLIGKDAAIEWRMQALENSNKNEQDRQDAAQAKLWDDQAAQGQEQANALTERQQRAEEAALIANRPKGSMVFSDYVAAQNKQGAFDFEKGKKKGAKLSEEVLKSGYLNYLRGLAAKTAEEAQASAPTAIPGQPQLDLGSVLSGFTHIPDDRLKPFSLDHSPATTDMFDAQGNRISRTAAEADADALRMDPRNDNQGELDLQPVMNRADRLTPLNDGNGPTEPPPPPGRSDTQIRRERAAKRAKSEAETAQTYAPVFEELDAQEKAAKDASSTRADAMFTQREQARAVSARMIANNKLADAAAAGTINGNTPIAHSDLMAAWKQEADTNGIKSTKQTQAKIEEAVATAKGKKLFMAQLNALREAREKSKSPAVQANLDLLLNRLENNDGKAKSVRKEDAGQGVTQAPTEVSGGTALNANGQNEVAGGEGRLLTEAERTLPAEVTLTPEESRAKARAAGEKHKQEQDAKHAAENAAADARGVTKAKVGDIVHLTLEGLDDPRSESELGGEPGVVTEVYQPGGKWMGVVVSNKHSKDGGLKVPITLIQKIEEVKNGTENNSVAAAAVPVAPAATTTKQQAAKTAQGQAARKVALLNAAPGSKANPTPPPVLAEGSGAAPVIVTSTGESRPVKHGEYATTLPPGDISYETPKLKKQDVAKIVSNNKRGFTHAKFHVEVPVSERRKIKNKNSLFAFEIVNYNPRAGRTDYSAEEATKDTRVSSDGGYANSGWYDDYVKALKQSLAKTANGTPTPQAKNAIAALKWLDEYEGSGISKRILLRATEGIFDYNKDMAETASRLADEISKEVDDFLLDVALNRKRMEAEGATVEEADAYTRQQLLDINNRLAKEDRMADLASGRKPAQIISAQEKAKRDEVLRIEGAQFIDIWHDVVGDLVVTDPRFKLLHAAAPNYMPTASLLSLVKQGKLGDVLAHLRDNGPSDWVQHLAQMLDNIGLGTSIRKINTEAYDEKGDRVYARYNHLTNTVEVYNGGENAHTLLHEVVHAATVGRIAMAKAALKIPESQRTAEQKSAVASLTTLRALMAATQKLDTKNQYAFKNEEEFVAEVLSNEDFQDWLRQQELDGRSYLRKFIDWVAQLFGANQYEGVNAFTKAIELSTSLLSDSRFLDTQNMTFNHSATGAAVQTDSAMSALVARWDTFAANHKIAGTLGEKMRATMWHASSTFNMEQWVDRIPALRPMVESMHQSKLANQLKSIVRQTKQMEMGVITTKISLALAKIPGAQRVGMDQKLMEFVGDMSQLNIDLNKNFDDNKRTNPSLDPVNRDYINRRHAEYMQLPAVFKEPVEESFRVYRKDYIQRSAMVLRDYLSTYSDTSPQLNALITLLDIRNPALDGDGKNPRPAYYHDAYSANLDKLVRKVLDEARGVSIGKDNLRADINDIERFYITSVSNPYMHLGRSGDYFIEFNISNAPGAWGALQPTIAKFGKAMGAQTDKGHVFMRFENVYQRNALNKELAKLGGYINQESYKSGSLFDADAMERMQGVPAFAKRLKNKAVADFPGPEGAKIRQWISHAVLDMYSETSAAKALIQRKEGGVAGYDLSFVRNFSKRAQGMATMLSNMYAMPEYDKAFNMMKEEVDKLSRPETAGQADMANEVFTEMSKRFANSITPVESPYIDAVKTFGFNYFLAWSPAFWVTNMAQPWHLTLPYLGGRYGFVLTAKEMGRSTSKGAKLMQAAISAGWSEGSKAGGARGAIMGILDLNLPIDKTGLSPGEVAFVRRLIESGHLDTTQGAQLARFADGASPGAGATTAAKMMSLGSHYTEVLNRLTAGLAGYNLSMTKDKKGEEAATLRGLETVEHTQFGYSDQNTARALGRHGVLGKVTPLVSSFQQYSFQAMELIIRMTADSLMPIPEGASPVEVERIQADRLAARKGLAGLMATTSIIAGTLGLPMASVASMLLNKMLGDSDDPADVQAAYRKWLADAVGKDMAELIARGVPRSLLGLDTSNRMGLQDVFPGSRFLSDRRDFKSKVEGGAFNLLGPAVSAGASMYTGASKFADGQIIDGLIDMLPIALKGPAKVIKMEESGFTTSTGNKLPIKVTLWGEIGQAFGFTPSAKAEQSEVNFQFRQRDMLLKQRKTKLSNALYKAVEAGDDATAEFKAVMEFSQTNPQYKINVQAGLQLRAKQRATAEITEIPTLPRYLPTLSRYDYANTN